MKMTRRACTPPAADSEGPSVMERIIVRALPFSGWVCRARRNARALPQQGNALAQAAVREAPAGMRRCWPARYPTEPWSFTAASDRSVAARTSRRRQTRSDAPPAADGRAGPLSLIPVALIQPSLIQLLPLLCIARGCGRLSLGRGGRRGAGAGAWAVADPPASSPATRNEEQQVHPFLQARSQGRARRTVFWDRPEI